MNAVPEERATAADFSLSINDLNVTQHLQDGAVSDHVTVALYGLAHGITHDWWSIFGSRDKETSLLRYRSGYLLPDIRMSFDGAAFEISAHQRFYDNPDVRFWGGTSELLSRRDGEAWLSNLVQEILAQLEGSGLKDTSAALRWKRVQMSRHSQEQSFCEAAGGMGLDPYQIDDEPAAFIESAEHLFGKEPLVEFVSGAGDVDRGVLMQWVEKMAKDRGFQYRLANARALVDAVARTVPSRPGEQAWAAGYRRARAMRKELDLKQGDRFASFMDFAKTFGAHKNFNLAPSVDGIKALRRDHTDGLHVHLRNHGDSAEANTAHLFAIARSIGDAACFPETDISPVNSLRYAYRQAAGRAFAAEFLAPIDEIDSMLEDKRDLISIANEFALSPTVIARQVENRNRIRQACSA